MQSISSLNITKDLKFVRCSDKPCISNQKGSFYQDSATTADLLNYGDKILNYFGGLSDNHERIGLMWVTKDRFDGFTWDEIFEKPIIDVGPKNSFDCNHVTDPASILVDGKVYLYYSGLGNGEDSIGLAISDDGFSFVKYNKPILKGRAPEIIFHKNKFYLFYVLPNENKGYTIHLACSTDGVHFEPNGAVFSPKPGGWDGYSVTTPRIIKVNDRFFMVYAADNQTCDFPKNFGLAFSDDLYNWTRYEKNPVFSRGSFGSWDDLAIWFGTIFCHNQVYYLFYEGCSQIKDRKVPVSQIGLAILKEGDSE